VRSSSTPDAAADGGVVSISMADQLLPNPDALFARATVDEARKRVPSETSGSKES